MDAIGVHASEVDERDSRIPDHFNDKKPLEKFVPAKTGALVVRDKHDVHETNSILADLLTHCPVESPKLGNVVLDVYADE